MSAAICVVRSHETAVLLGGRTSRLSQAPRKEACRLVSGSSSARARYWNWFDKLRFHVFG